VRRLLRTAGLVAVLGLFACGGPQGQRPRDTLQAFADALGRSDYSSAYDLMSTRYKARHTRKEFVDALTADPTLAQETAGDVKAGLDDLEVHAALDYGLDERMDLIIDGNSWKLDSDPLAFYSQDTPRDALRTFIRAAERKRYDVLLRLVPDALTQGDRAVTLDNLKADFEGTRKVEIANLLLVLRQNIAAPIDESGDAARMPYGDAYEMRFVREDGVWKVAQLN
jgi:hypothetical protein